MIFSLPSTTTGQIAKKLVTIREGSGQQTTGRVLTLIVIADGHDDLDGLLAAASAASREHPARVLVLITDNTAQTTTITPTDTKKENEASKLSAEIRIGGHAGASEMIIITLSGPVAGHLISVVTPLLLPDTPIVVWWPSKAPTDLKKDPIGAIAQRRITDMLLCPMKDSIYTRRNNYSPGDSDIAWARLTPWRGVVASTLDQPPHEPVTDAAVYGPPHSPSVDIAAGWLADRLGITVDRHVVGKPQTREECASNPTAISKAVLVRQSSTITITITDEETIKVHYSDVERSSLVALSHRCLPECLAEELRRLEPDDAYGRALRGLNRVNFIDERS